MQEKTTFSVADIKLFKKKALTWANAFRVVACLDNNFYTEYNYSDNEFQLAVDAVDSIEATAGNAFNRLKEFADEHKEKYTFGYLSYDLKNEVEQLQSDNSDYLHFPDLYFFEPRYLLRIAEGKVEINRNYPEAFFIFDSINNTTLPTDETGKPIELQSRVSKEEYINNVEKIRQHIEEGDVYEMNYCIEYFSEEKDFQPLPFFLRLNENSMAPFSAFIKIDSKYVLCASPERFLKKQGNKLISQPIKGTIRKSSDNEENIALKAKLYHDNKERAENVMIVDLVRNDLTKSARTGTIKVEELFRIYEFATINQMISTVTAELREDVHPVDAIKNAFPMGSMTGAPKVKAMELIEHYESTKRGVYSGAIGYFSPSQDFDFNVVIRSLLFNAESGYLSLQVGGAITYDSVPEKEFQEIETKSAMIKQLLRIE